MTALASAVPGDTAGQFARIPFVLLSHWRVATRDGGVVVVAQHRRRLPQEASPLEERTLVIAEADSLFGDLVTVYSERSHGPEESVQAVEFVVALHSLRRDRPGVLLSRDDGAGMVHALIERQSQRGRSWAVRWTTPRQVC
jgi:hypothetical protein